MLFYTAQAYVFFPGGFGTVDEFFELVTLVQTKKIDRETVPLVLIGKDFWSPLVTFMRGTMLDKYQAIGTEDMDLFKLVDTAEEAFAIITSSPPRKEVYY